jgi:GrpB-like predicted nucleotidyltransferase (UPF0157 family)
MGMIREIKVVVYNPEWPTQYAAEAERLRTTFGDTLIDIHHIGSTSVPGMSAKPILDMMPLVRDLDDVEASIPGLTALGYEFKGENGIAGRRYFTKGPDHARTHHVHCYHPDNPEVARHLDFRDYLIAHPEEAAAYARLKQEVARQFPTDINGYMAGKDAFIRQTIRKAQAWRGLQKSA